MEFNQVKAAAETLALSDGCYMSFTESLAKEVIYSKRSKDIRIDGYTDNLSLYETLNTAKPILDKRLRVEISAFEKCARKTSCRYIG